MLRLTLGTTAQSSEFLKNIRKYNSCFQMTSFGASSIIRHEVRIYKKNAKFPIVMALQRMLHECNEHIKLFKTTLERLPDDEHKIVIRADKKPPNEHERRFNSPQVDEVAVIISGTEFEQRDIVLHRRGHSLQRIAETHRCYDSLQYPIIFPYGEDGFHFNLRQINPLTGANTLKKVSSMDFYRYRLMVREGENKHILHCRQLFHQFVVDMYAKIESERLLFIRRHQQQLRIDQYIHLRDALHNDGNVSNIGSLVILLASFTRGPRHMHEYTQDAMTYVRMYGRPDLFSTFTCNPSWEEIKNELFDGQSANDRHDLLARVFKQKQAKLIDVITKSHIFGKSRCWMYTIEWQKRGLPHSHNLIWLVDKIQPIQIDDVISAELPNRMTDPVLFEIIKKKMIHGPCGTLNPESPCMKEGKCSKKYPRAFLQETQSGDDGYPLYRRRSPAQGGFIATLERPSGTIEVDNRWVVPYSPLLSKMFQAHINVEYCNSIKSIKYVCKYVNKGSDMAVFKIDNGTNVDEATSYQLGRYISSNEAVWRILGFSIHERHPTVVHLSVHLENRQRVIFDRHNASAIANSPPNTNLTAFFQLCQTDTFARTLLYPEVPAFYTWNASRKTFCKIKQGRKDHESGQFSSDALRRVYTVHPNNAECFYLRMLLHTSLILLENKCMAIRNEPLTTFGLPSPVCDNENVLQTDFIREKKYDVEQLNVYIAQNEPMLNEDQQTAYDKIMSKIARQEEGIIFLDAPGGTGKTFLTNLILAKIRANGDVALALASSGIATTLIDGGRTAHSALNLPLDIARKETPTLNISKTSGKAEVLKKCKLIVWDECTMAHKKSLEALNNSLKDLRENDKLMGGALVLLH
uniref:ATP-dependent DNA helicase n=1 Tax=Anopheles dirus TaxID=7168 RepID=A0A182NCC1_9DIPT